VDSLITFALVGLGIGSLYVLAAQGLIVIFRGSGVLNLGLGAIGMVGAYMAWDATNGVFLAWEISPQPFWVALLVGTAASAAVGALVQQFIMRPLAQRSALVKVIATLGVLVTLQALVILRWTSVAKVPESVLPQDLIPVFTTRINADKFILLGIAILVTVALYVFYRYTRFGLSTTAIAENETVAASLGLSPNRIALINWAIGSGLAGVFAIFIAPTVTLQPTVMTNLVLAATSVALVASFRSFPIALLAGLGIGVAQTVVQGKITGVPGIGAAVPFIIIVLWLTLRGQGIPSRDFILQKLPSVGNGRLRWPLIGAAVVVVVTMAFSVQNVWLDGLIITMAAGIMMLSVVVRCRKPRLAIPRGAAYRRCRDNSAGTALCNSCGTHSRNQPGHCHLGPGHGALRIDLQQLELHRRYRGNGHSGAGDLRLEYLVGIESAQLHDRRARLLAVDDHHCEQPAPRSIRTKAPRSPRE
jgi:sulfate-transporting ATPase